MDDERGEATPARVRRFIEERRTEVLLRAIETLRTCPADQLVAQVHRLKGTLGLYELTEAQAAVAELERSLLAQGRTSAAGDADGTGQRTQALERLRELSRRSE